MARLYGKLTFEHLRQLVELVPVIDELRRGFKADMRLGPGKLRRLIGDGVDWSALYEKRIEEHLVHFLVVAGLGPLVKEALNSDDPTQYLINDARREDVPDWSGGTGGLFKPSDLLAVLYSLDFNMQCVMLYGTYVNDLVAQARAGDDAALLTAIRVDPSVISGPTGSRRLARAIVEDDWKFVEKLRAAMGRKTGRQAAYLRRFRFVMTMLHEGGALQLPQRDLEALVFELGLYSNLPGARKNVRELIRKAMKAHAI